MHTFQFDFENASYEDTYSQVAMYNSYPQSPASKFERLSESLGIFNTANREEFQEEGLDDLINPRWMEEYCVRPQQPAIYQNKQVGTAHNVDINIPRGDTLCESFGLSANQLMPKCCWGVDPAKDESTSTINEVNTVDSPLNEPKLQNHPASNSANHAFRKSALKFDDSPTNSHQEPQAIVLIDLVADNDDDSTEILDVHRDAWDPQTKCYRLILDPSKRVKKISRKQKERSRN